MKKIVPFKKDIIFGTSIAEITSISLEHSFHSDGDNIFSGEFIVGGEYKINDASISPNNFNHQLPFTIEIDDIYDTTNAVIDIDDFYYEITNNNSLSVYIDVLIDNLEEIIREEIIVPEIEERHIEEIIDIIPEIEERHVEEIIDVIPEVEVIKDDVPYGIKSLFDKIDDTDEKYSTYHIYIVREGDNIDGIMARYGVNREEMEQYNDLNDIKLGDKLIIPSNATN